MYELEIDGNEATEIESDSLNNQQVDFVASESTGHISEMKFIKNTIQKCCMNREKLSVFFVGVKS